jgi:transposase
MGEVTTVGLDLAKHVSQVHGVDAEGVTVLRKQLRPPGGILWRSAPLDS